MAQVDDICHRRYELEGQITANSLIVHRSDILKGTLGLYLRIDFACRRDGQDKIPVIKLLVGEKGLYFYVEDVELVAPEEIKQIINNHDSYEP